MSMSLQEARAYYRGLRESRHKEPVEMETVEMLDAATDANDPRWKRIHESQAWRAEKLASDRRHEIEMNQLEHDLHRKASECEPGYHILITVCHSLAIKASTIVYRDRFGQLRRGQASLDRWAVWHRMYQLGMSYPSIAAIFGSSHSSVIEGVKRFRSKQNGK